MGSSYSPIFWETFNLEYIIYLEDIRKKSPFSPIQNTYASIREFFVTQFNEEEISEFTKEEMAAINDAIPKDSDMEVTAICTTTLSTFRSVNFILEIDQTDYNTYFYNNEFFVIKHWDKSINKDKPAIEQAKTSLDEVYVDEILQIENGFKILKLHSIGNLINGLVNHVQISTLYIAVGFVFQSGLQILSSTFEKLAQAGNECEIIVGALQNYDSEIVNNKIDRTTIRHLNDLLHTGHVQLLTYRPSFYHGKFYYMSNAEKAYVIVGSSNISKSAFQNNYELDVIYVMERESSQDKQFREWFFDLRKKCESIQYLDEQNFEEYYWNSELDAYDLLKKHIVSSFLYNSKCKG